MIQDTFKIDVPVDLTAEELVRMKDDLARAAVELEEVTDEARESAAGYREELKELKGRVRNLARTIKAGQVQRPVECRHVLDPEARTVETIRIDTGEVIDSRAALPEELQGALDLQDTPTEFLPGNLVSVETVAAAAGAIYEIESITDRGGTQRADLVLALTATATAPPPRLEQIDLGCLVKAVMGDRADAPVASKSTTRKGRGKAA